MTSSTSHRVSFAALLMVGACASTTTLADVPCSPFEKAGTVTHEGKILQVWQYGTQTGPIAVVIAQDMRVNADGADAAYAAKGQHGLSYLCDGASVSAGGSKFSTQDKLNCANAVTEIDALPIVDDTIVFPASMTNRLCVAGFEVLDGEKCGSSSTLIGGGKPARAKVQWRVRDARGAPMAHFESTTSLRHGQDGGSLDSLRVPFVVAPQFSAPSFNVSQAQFAYVISDGRTKLDDVDIPARRVPVVVGDLGPKDKFGEGSIAVHQLLAYGGLRPAPAYDPKVCAGLSTTQCDAAKRPYELTKNFPYPFEDKHGGDVRPKRNWSTRLLYVFFPDSDDKRRPRYSFENDLQNASGSVVDGARDAAQALGGIERIEQCIRSTGKIANFE